MTDQSIFNNKPPPIGGLKIRNHQPLTPGHGSKSHTPSEHPNPTIKIDSKMGGEFTYQPKWDQTKTVLTTTAT